MFTACSDSAEVETDTTGEPATSTPEPVLKETAQPYAEPIESIEIHSAKMWNEFAESYNSEREKYADYITVNIIGELDFENAVIQNGKNRASKSDGGGIKCYL